MTAEEVENAENMKEVKVMRNITSIIDKRKESCMTTPVSRSL
jgi:hypothetical protein